MKCDMSVQTEATLKNINYVFDLVPHTEKALVGFEKIRFVTLDCHENNLIWVTYGQKKNRISGCICSCIDHSHRKKEAELTQHQFCLFSTLKVWAVAPKCVLDQSKELFLSGVHYEHRPLKKLCSV